MSEGRDIALVARSAALFEDAVCHHSPFRPTQQIFSIFACVSRTSPTRLPKYSPKAELVFSRQARVHSESPMNQIRSIEIPASVRLVTEERASLVASTAALSSDRGVVILLFGVTRGFAQRS